MKDIVIEVWSEFADVSEVPYESLENLNIAESGMVQAKQLIHLSDVSSIKDLDEVKKGWSEVKTFDGSYFIIKVPYVTLIELKGQQVHIKSFI